jgi:hypothetical protein
MQVTRRRVAKERLLGSRGRRRLRLATTGTAILALVAVGSGVGSASTEQFGTDQVGQVTERGQVVSADQYLKPLGDRLVVDNGKIMASTVSPDGSHLAALTTDGGIALTIVNLQSWTVQQLVGNSATANLRIPGNDVGQEGPSYSPDGRTLWLAQADGYRRFTVNPDGTLAGARCRHRRCSRRTGPLCTPRSTVRTASSPSTRRPARAGRVGPSATPHVTWPWAATGSTSATRAAARRAPATTR